MHTLTVPSAGMKLFYREVHSTKHLHRPRTRVVQASVVRYCHILRILTKLAIAVLHLVSICSLRFKFSSSMTPRYLTLGLFGMVLPEIVT